MSAALVEAVGLTREYRRPRRPAIRALDGVDLAIRPGETLGLVGESGCGKSTLGRLLLRLDRPTAGSVRFEGRDLAACDAATLRSLRRRFQIVFQDPYPALNPRLTIGASVSEGLEVHRLAAGAKLRRRVGGLLEEVGLDPADADRYPHELSGGQRQRVGIARALAVEPVFLVCDEPVSALDVSVRAQILALLRRLQERHGLTMLFIAHDLAAVRQVAHRIAVMYLGRVVEEAEADRLVRHPLHPYTRALLSAVPDLDPARSRSRIVLEGDPAGGGVGAGGCAFAGRCWHPARDDRCRREAPMLRTVADTLVACHHAERDPMTTGVPAP